MDYPLDILFGEVIFKFLKTTELGAIHSVNPGMKSNKKLTYCIEERKAKAEAAFARIQEYIEKVDNHPDQFYAFLENEPPPPKTFFLARNYYEFNNSELVKKTILKAVDYAEFDIDPPVWYQKFVNSFN